MPNYALTVIPHENSRGILAVETDGITQPPVVARMTVDNLPYIMPSWCTMSNDEHACVWGCMGISQGYVAKQGRLYCTMCEYYCPEEKTTQTITSERLERPDDYDSFSMGLTIQDDLHPSCFPCYAVLYRYVGRNRWGYNEFINQVEFLYEHLEGSRVVLKRYAIELVE